MGKQHHCVECEFIVLSRATPRTFLFTYCQHIQNNTFLTLYILDLFDLLVSPCLPK